MPPRSLSENIGQLNKLTPQCLTSRMMGDCVGFGSEDLHKQRDGEVTALGPLTSHLVRFLIIDEMK